MSKKAPGIDGEGGEDAPIESKLTDNALVIGKGDTRLRMVPWVVDGEVVMCCQMLVDFVLDHDGSRGKPGDYLSVLSDGSFHIESDGQDFEARYQRAKSGSASMITV